MKQSASPRLVLFDLDNTLIDRAEVFRRWGSCFVAQRGLAPDELSWLIDQDNDGLTPKDAFFDAVRTRYAVSEDTAALVSAYHRDYPSFTVAPPAETMAALTELRSAGSRLAIVTNGPPMQEHVIDNAGLRGIVDAVCVSATVGLRKPDPLIFGLAAHACGVALDGAWMIGDSPTHDIAGAVASGIRSAWITRGRPWVETEYQPTLIADSVSKAVEGLLAFPSPT